LNNVENLDKKYVLPNGLKIHHVNKHETDFMYKDIFEDLIYLRNGITIKKNSCVVDVGGNIGLFSLFVKQNYHDAKIFAFEPMPILKKIFQFNLKNYDNVQVSENGLSNESKEEILTYYPGYSLMSGFHCDFNEDSKILSECIEKDFLKENPNLENNSDRILKLLSQTKLNKKQTMKCKLTTLSAFIELNNIQQIDLLKINAEKSELNILNGVKKNDWLKIKQIILEVNDLKGSLKKITEKLTQNNFDIIVEKEDRKRTSYLFNIYARRK
jgi:FkbM family methyltransferase